MYNNKIIQKDMKEIINSGIDFSSFMNKTVLITGANGMLASYYMYVLMYLNDHKKLNIKIYALVRNIKKLEDLTNYSARNDIIPIQQDVCEKIELQDKIDYIIHMASSANPKTIVKDPVGIIKANIEGTFSVLELARKNNAKVIFTSTREIYGKMPSEINEIREENMGSINPIELRSCYPESKRMAENIMVSYSYQYGIDYCISRIAHVYGPGMNIDGDGRIMSDLIEAVVKKKNIVLKSTGEAERAFCYITDAIKALYLITLDKNKNQVYNIANETETITIKKLAYNLVDWYKDENIEVVFDIKDEKNKYVSFKRTKLNTDKLEALGWKPNIALKEGIDRTVKYFNNN